MCGWGVIGSRAQRGHWVRKRHTGWEETDKKQKKVLQSLNTFSVSNKGGTDKQEEKSKKKCVYT